MATFCGETGVATVSGLFIVEVAFIGLASRVGEAVSLDIVVGVGVEATEVIVAGGTTVLIVWAATMGFDGVVFTAGIESVFTAGIVVVVATEVGVVSGAGFTCVFLG